MKSKLYTLQFISIALANLFMVSSLGAFFLFPLFVAERGGDKTDIGLIMGAMALSSVFCRPWVAEMVDRVGRKRSYTLGTLIMGLLPFVYLLFQGDLDRFYLPLLLVRLIHGVGVAICFTSVFTYVADIVPAERLGEGLSMFGITGLAGMALGPAVAEIIIRRYGFSWYFLTGAGLGLTSLLIHLPLAESMRPSGHGPGISFFQILGTRRMLLVAVLAMFFGIGLASSGTFVAPWAKDRQVEFISLYYLAYSVAAIMTRLLGGRLADRIGEVKIVPWALALTAAGPLLLVFLSNSYILMLAGLVFGTGHGFLYPTLNTLAIRGQPVHFRGKINGIYTGGIDAGVFLGSIGLGYIGDWSGFRAIFLVAGLVVASGLILFRVIYDRSGLRKSGSF